MYKTRKIDCGWTTTGYGELLCECQGWKKNSDTTICKSMPDTIIVKNGDEDAHVHIYFDHEQTARERMANW